MTILALKEEKRQQIKRRLSGLAERSDFDGLMNVRVVEGSPDSAIVDVAARTGCDLIVMGTNDRTGLKRFLEGVLPNGSCDMPRARYSSFAANEKDFMKKPKFTFRTFDLEGNVALEKEARRGINELAEIAAIDRAHVVLRRHRGWSPRFAAAGQLVVPGPDFLAVAQDQTPGAALRKLTENLRTQVLMRHARQQGNWKTKRRLRRAPARLGALPRGG
jgi:hypothetical protein